MPTSTLPPDATDHSMAHHVETARDGDGAMLGCAAPPPEVLLPSGGTTRPGDPEDGVMGDAVFRRQVEAIRAQLAPLHSRRALASSYGREAAVERLESLPATVDGRRAPSRDVVTPLQVAYALRWLELGQPSSRDASWPDLLEGPLE